MVSVQTTSSVDVKPTNLTAFYVAADEPRVQKHGIGRLA